MRLHLSRTRFPLLVAHGCNVGFTPVIGGADALRYGRLSHVDQTYLRMETYRQANHSLIEAQAAIPLARAWGGGLVASVDGMRFVVPVPSVYARPNPKYFGASTGGSGRRAGATWLNLISDQAAGLGGKVVAGTPRDSLYVLDVLYDRDGGRRPEMVVTDTASYSDIVFGLLTLAGFAYASQLADLPDQKLWRIDRTADYGAFNDAARGRVDLERIERNWEDVLRIIGSIHTGAVRAYDVIRILSRDGRPTVLGDAIAHYGRSAHRGLALTHSYRCHRDGRVRRSDRCGVDSLVDSMSAYSWKRSARYRRTCSPFVEASGLPKALGDGTWHTVSDTKNAPHVGAVQRCFQ